MREFRHSPFESTLEIVATLRDGSIRSHARAMKEHEAFVSAVADLYRKGVDINSLSDASGLTPKEIMVAAGSGNDELTDLAGTR